MVVVGTVNYDHLEWSYSLQSSNAFYFGILKVYFNFIGKRIKGTKNIVIFHLLFHLPNACANHDWVILEPAVRRGPRCRGPRTWAITCCFLEWALAGNNQKWRNCDKSHWAPVGNTGDLTALCLLLLKSKLHWFFKILNILGNVTCNSE